MRIPNRKGLRRTGILDFQDAAIGNGAYDVVSLLEDARRDIPKDVKNAAISKYLLARPDLDKAIFLAALAAHSALRHLRVTGLLVRSALRDKKPQYLIHGPRCWMLLAAALEHHATAPLRDFLDQNIKNSLRQNPAFLS